MILLISLLWFALGRGKQSINFEFRRKVEKTETDGLKFVDATHPYIRVTLMSSILSYSLRIFRGLVCFKILTSVVCRSLGVVARWWAKGWIIPWYVSRDF